MASDHPFNAVKPDNVIFLSHTLVWRLLDMGIVSEAGTHTAAKCTLRWAPPEVVIAMAEQRHITVQASHDMWAVRCPALPDCHLPLCITTLCLQEHTRQIVSCALSGCR